MKGILKGLGVLLIVCGLILVFVFTNTQESVKPNKISVGVMWENGEFSQMDSGYIGGNQQGYETMESFKGIGFMCCVAGAVAFGVSFAIKKI